jgi:diadenosine tetraphosphate (Ap4A) HIT family hydrolase
VNYDAECDFCIEISSTTLTEHFATIYADALRTRLIVSRPHTVVMPTIGQMFDGSLLILPREHHPTIAGLPKDVLAELLVVAEDEIRNAGEYVVAFEHGAFPSTEASCGIYHAHMHVVPVPCHVSVQDVLPKARLAETLKTALAETQTADEYLIFRDTENRVGRVIPVDRHAYPSQYFRRELHRHFQCTRPWNWREYDQREQALIDVVRRRAAGTYVADIDNRDDFGRFGNVVATRIGA